MSSIPAVSPLATPSLRGPFRLAIALLVVTTITILWGAMTTSTGSGLAFLDWPLSDGKLMPERSLTTLPGFFEHFHRIFGALAGMLSLGLWAWVEYGQGLQVERATRLLARGGLALIVVQGVVGGVGVLKGLPALTSVTHGTLAQLTLALFAVLAYQLSERHRRTAAVTTVAPGTGRRVVAIGVLVLVVQTVVGAIARHTNSPHALWTHVGNALVVFFVATIATAFALGRLGEVPGLKGVCQTTALLLILQIALGFVALLIRNSAGKSPENVANLGTASVISIHVLLGSLLTVLMTTLGAHVFRATRVPEPTPSGAAA